MVATTRDMVIVTVKVEVDSMSEAEGMAWACARAGARRLSAATRATGERIFWKRLFGRVSEQIVDIRWC